MPCRQNILSCGEAHHNALKSWASIELGAGQLSAPISAALSPADIGAPAAAFWEAR